MLRVQMFVRTAAACVVGRGGRSVRVLRRERDSREDRAPVPQGENLTLNI